MPETNLFIKKEFRELVNLLNRGNKLQNEKTEVYFYIAAAEKEFYLFAAIDVTQKLLLCKTHMKKWTESRNTRFNNLELFIANLLKRQLIMDSSALTQLIRNAIFPTITDADS